MSIKTLPLVAITAAFTVGLVAGCDSKPSEDECNKAADHYLELLNEEQGSEGPMAEMNQEMRDGMQSDCTQSGSKKWIECVNNAKTVADAEGCEK